MKAGWVEKKLGEVCELKPQKSEVRDRLDAEDMVSFAPMEDLGINQKYLSATQTRPLGEVVGSYTYFAEGDVLLAKITPCFENGKLGIAKDLCNGVGFGSSEYMVFRSAEALNNEFLYYYLSRQRFREEGAQNMSGAVGHKRVAKEFVENYPIPIPPLVEQERLVALLDEAFAGIDAAKANAERNLNNARALFDNYLAQVFSQRGEGWLEKRLCDIVDFKSGGTPSKANSDYWRGDIPWVSPKDMKSSVIYESIDHISETAVKNSATSLISAGSVLMVVRSGILARIVPIAITGRDLAINQDIKALCPHKNIDSEYLFYFLQGKMPDLLSMVSRGATVHRLQTDFIRMMRIAVPPLPDQQAIVAKLDALSAETKKLEAIYRQKIAALDELKQSLLHQAFTGEL